jgi:hypothetical protein
MLSETQKVAKRMLWLAYQKSRLVGMGFMQARNDITEDIMWDNHHRIDGDKCEVFADYGYGRMMKLHIAVKGDTLEYREGPTNIEYQSWGCAYATYKALEDAARESLKEVAA